MLKISITLPNAQRLSQILSGMYIYKVIYYTDSAKTFHLISILCFRTSSFRDRSIQAARFMHYRPLLAETVCRATNAYDTRAAISVVLCTNAISSGASHVSRRCFSATRHEAICNGQQILTKHSPVQTHVRRLSSSTTWHQGPAPSDEGTYGNYQSILASRPSADGGPVAQKRSQTSVKQKNGHAHSIRRVDKLTPRLSESKHVEKRASFLRLKPTNDPQWDKHREHVVAKARDARKYKEGYGRRIPVATPKESSHGDAHFEDGAKHIDYWRRHMKRIVDLTHHLNESKKNGVELSDGIRAKAEEVFAYNGMAIRAQESRMTPLLPLPWALEKSKFRELDGYKVLDQEIHDFAAFIESTEAERAARKAIISELQALIAKTVPQNVNTELFGSEKTGLALPYSDIDLRLYNAQSDSHNSKHDMARSMTHHLIRLYHDMQNSQDWICVVMRHAHFPIISAQHKATGIDVQIVSSPGTEPQQNATSKYMAEFPHLRSLYMVARTMLGMRGLVDVFLGGIGSYGTLMMLVASLKHGGRDVKSSAALSLEHFLRFYAEFRPESSGISIDPPKLFKKHDLDANAMPPEHSADASKAAQHLVSRRKPWQPYLLCLQDPATPTNDLGRKSHAIKHILKTIKFLNDALIYNLQNLSDAQRKGKPYEHESLLLPIVGRCHEVYRERRIRIEEYGREVLRQQTDRVLAAQYAEQAITTS